VILRIDHVGVVTDDPPGFGAHLAALGMRLDDAGTADAYGVSCHFWAFDGLDGGSGPPSIELVAPVRDDSAVSGYLARKGPGLYHIAFEVDDVELELTRLHRHGFVPVDAKPCAGARQGMQVAFMLTRKPAGLLIELVQYST
jgi:methylmalonyl-CoA/ethylmalonyl-CoA epimerase